jgi:hypothetical protein
LTSQNILIIFSILRTFVSLIKTGILASAMKAGKPDITNEISQTNVSQLKPRRLLFFIPDREKSAFLAFFMENHHGVR